MGLEYSNDLQGPIWRSKDQFGDEVTYPQCRTSYKLDIWQFSATRFGAHGPQKVAHHFVAHSCLFKTPLIAIWGSCFFRRGPIESPIDPLSVPIVVDVNGVEQIIDCLDLSLAHAHHGSLVSNIHEPSSICARIKSNW